MGPRRKQYDAFEAISFYNTTNAKRQRKIREAILAEKIRRAGKKPGKIVRRKRGEV